jgi:hypothetical protein
MINALIFFSALLQWNISNADTSFVYNYTSSSSRIDKFYNDGWHQRRGTKKCTFIGLAQKIKRLAKIYGTSYCVLFWISSY